MKRWRILRNEWNLCGAPWSGAVGIEEDDEELEVPAIICWFTRGWTKDNQPTPDHPAHLVVRLHNEAVDAEETDG